MKAKGIENSKAEAKTIDITKTDTKTSIKEEKQTK
jgi:hypothetical protein